MSKKNNYDQMYAMARAGLSNEVIANRLNVSVRKAQRARLRLAATGPVPKPWIKTSQQEETMILFYHYACGETLDWVAWRFGVSPQRIYQVINNYEQQKG